MNIIAPKCCKYAKWFITLRYEDYWVKDKDYFIDNKPHWNVRGSKYDENTFRELIKIVFPKDYKISYCPLCGKKLPDIQMKKELPEKVLTVVDAGYYCDTCSERLIACTCSRPEEMWELKKDEYVHPYYGNNVNKVWTKED